MRYSLFLGDVVVHLPGDDVTNGFRGLVGDSPGGFPSMLCESG